MTDTVVSLYLTAESEDVGVHIATDLVKEKLVACANVQSGMRSIYEWDGLLQLDNEVAIIMKTTKSKMDAVTAKVKELHSYDTPCLVATEVIGGNEDYLNWVRNQVS